MKTIFASLWVLLFSAISYIVAYEAYASPNETNHAVDFALIGFILINFPAGLLNFVNPFWDNLTEIGLSLGLTIAWSEAIHVILTNGILGYLWWFVAFPRIINFARS